MMARQSRRARPKAPRMAPTQMKTVPSGTLDVRKYGALSLGGTVGAGYVGTEVSAAEVVLKVGMSELAELSLVLRLGISLDADVAAAELSPALADVAPSVGMASVVVASVVAASVVVATSVVAASVAVASSAVVAANTPAVRSEREKTVDRSSERFRESRDLPMLAWSILFVVPNPQRWLNGSYFNTALVGGVEEEEEDGDDGGGDADGWNLV